MDKVTPEMLAAWVDYDPLGRGLDFAQTVKYGQLVGFMKSAFYAGYLSAIESDRERLAKAREEANNDLSSDTRRTQSYDASRAPTVRGVSRVADNERCLLVSFDARPTDDELRAFHDRLASRVVDDVEAIAVFERWIITLLPRAGDPEAAALIDDLRAFVKALSIQGGGS